MIEEKGTCDEVNQKLAEVHNILQYLAEKHNVHYCLAFNRIDKNGIKLLQHNVLFNDKIGNESLIMFQESIEELRNQINLIPNMVKTGKIMAICMDASNLPENMGDKLEQNMVYEVIAVMRTANPNVFAYKLAGMETNKPYDGYNSGRFQLVRVKENLN